jgi:nucleoid DNA-binding protein
MNEKYNKSDLVHEIAKRADFTVGDVNIIWNTFEDIVREIIANQDELIIAGLFKIDVTEIDEHEAYDGIHKKPYHREKGHRINIRTSRSLLQLFKTPS